MKFEDDYISILKFAKQKVRDFHLNIDANDLVNDAYVNLSNKPYSLTAFLKEINNLTLQEKHATPQNISFGTKGAPMSFRGDYTCTKCKLTKSAQEFRIENRKFGKVVLRTECKECEYKAQRKYVKPNRKPVERKKNKQAVRKFVLNNRSKWNSYLKERSKSDVKNLPDRYIRKLIRSRYKDAATPLLNNSAFVYSYRKMLIEKRLGNMKNVA